MIKNLFFRYRVLQAGIYETVLPEMLPKVLKAGTAVGWLAGCIRGAALNEAEDSLRECRGEAPLTPMKKMAMAIPHAAVGAAKGAALSATVVVTATTPLLLGALGVAACVKRANKP